MKFNNKKYEKFKKELIIHLPDVERFIYTITDKDNQIKDDIAQNTFLAAIEHWDQLRSLDRIKSWLFSIAENEAKIYYKKHPFSVEYHEEAFLENKNETVDQLANDISDLLQKRESIEDLDDAIMLLGNEGQHIIILYYYYDLSLKDISQILNINYNTIKTIHRRALKRLKELLSKKKEGVLNEG